jgi:glycine cleavage system aminomethyltransferase T
VLEKDHFVGRTALLEVQNRGPAWHFSGLEIEWKSTFEKFNTLWARLQRRIPSKAPETPSESPNTERAINTLAIDLFKSGRML